jgi:hypothetical protein
MTFLVFSHADVILNHEFRSFLSLLAIAPVINVAKSTPDTVADHQFWISYLYFKYGLRQNV